MNQQFGYEALGLFQSDEEADNSPQPQFGKSKSREISNTKTRTVMVLLMQKIRWLSEEANSPNWYSV